MANDKAFETSEALRRRAAAAAEELKATHAKLDAQVRRKTELARENVSISAELREQVLAGRANVELQRQLLRVREDEQRRIARDLHDEVGQTMTVLRFALASVRQSGPLPQAAEERLGDVDRVVEQLARELGEVASRLRPATLDKQGLLPALHQLVADWSARTGITVDFASAGVNDRLPAEVETTLYRVVQEALTNVARHAQARHVSVVVQRDSEQAVACIEDDGKGFDPNDIPRGHLGIMGMRERVGLASGTLEIESGFRQGATIIARVPLAAMVESA